MDHSDPDVQALEPKMRRADMTEMSFAFRVNAQRWESAPGFDKPFGPRTITEVSLHKGDVSVVNFGANPTTSAELLGKRKGKGVNRKTLSLAEAQSVSLVGNGRSSKPTRSGSKPTRAFVRPPLTLSKALFDQEADAMRCDLGDAIVDRANEILASLGLSEAGPTSAGRDYTAGPSPPSMGSMIASARADTGGAGPTSLSQSCAVRPQQSKPACSPPGDSRPEAAGP